MVIQTSDSCNTLVGLETNPKAFEASSKPLPNNDYHYVRTALYLAESETREDVHARVPVYLTKSGRVDDCMKHVPQLVESCDEFLASPTKYFDKSSPERILYVCQGEVAHAVPLQCDVIVSDKATTCHILAVRSESSSCAPITSLAHIDGTCYEKCIRSIFTEHRDHHDSEEKIKVQLYVVGGFDDMDSTSIRTSNWLLHVLAQIAHDEEDTMVTTLRLCAVSSLNDNGYASPVARGLGIDVRSGQPFLAKVHESAAGPASRLRSARLFAGSDELSLIHGPRSSKLRIEPFRYHPFPEIDQLIQLPDQIMLQYMSTSPDVEEPCFCSSLRATLRFVRDVHSTTVFGSSVDQPLIYNRAESNSWSRCC